VLNDSRVFPARLFGHRAGRTGEVEVLLLRPVDSAAREWEALVHPGKKMRVGERVRFADGLEAEVIARREFGERTLRFATEGDVYEEFERIGHVPLPPYIKRRDEAADRERYQTVFAREKGSAAAPTAGLHFTPEVLDACRARGAEIAFVTLHVGLGTFQPIHGDRIEGHRLHSEHYRITADNAARMAAARRLVAVGTTSVRSIESAMKSAMRGGGPAGVERRNGPVHLSGLRVSRHRRDAHQFSFAAHQSAAAGVRFRRQGPGAGRLPARGGAALPVLFVRRLHVNARVSQRVAGTHPEQQAAQQTR
jgi:S-adenosylmethionine:tRNA ribosyltransferase-isomerase